MSKKVASTAENSEAQEDLVKYELMAIVMPDLSHDDYKKSFEELKKSIEHEGGTISHEEEWGKRQLAYRIKNQQYGYYVVFHFEAPSEKVMELNRQMRLTPFVMRHLLTKTPKNYVPQQYDLDAAPQPQKPIEKETEKIQPRETPREKPVRRQAAAPAPKPIKQVEKEVLSEKESKEKFEKLDEKLEKLLSGEDDFKL